MNNFLQRTLSGAVFAAIVMAMVWSGPAGLITLLWFIGIAGLYEYLKMNRLFQPATWLILSLFHSLLLLSSGLIEMPLMTKAWLLISSVSLTLIFILQQLWKYGIKTQERLSSFFFPLLYIAFPLLLFARFSLTGGEYLFLKPLMVIFLVWSSDTFAYLSGKWLGRKPLFPELSPKKTVEGFVGGTVLTALLGALLCQLWNLAPWYWGLALGLFVSITGTAGDLFESSLKRKANIKDSGKLIPGHGGVLDRFDAFLFVCVLAWIWDSILNLMS